MTTTMIMASLIAVKAQSTEQERGQNGCQFKAIKLADHCVQNGRLSLVDKLFAGGLGQLGVPALFPGVLGSTGTTKYLYD